MSDFIRWLYANYVKPQLEQTSPIGYEQALSMMDTSLDQQLHKEYSRALEFYASAAFLLGVRMGAGLGPVLKEEPH